MLLPRRHALPEAIARLSSRPSCSRPPACSVWLEIGFGGGEHLALAGRAPTPTSALSAASRSQRRGQGPGGDRAGRRSAISGSMTDDARDLLRCLPAGVARPGLLLFPDPWPKRRHREAAPVAGGLWPTGARHAAGRRAALRAPTSATTPRDAAGRCSPDGGFALERRRARATGGGAAADWPATRYEAKALRRGAALQLLLSLRASSAGKPMRCSAWPLQGPMRAERPDFKFRFKLRNSCLPFHAAHDHLNSESGPYRVRSFCIGRLIEREPAGTAFEHA